MSSRRASTTSSEGSPAVRRNSTTKRGSVSGIGHKLDALKFSRNESQGPDDFPHATKKNMAEYLVKLEQQFILTPQRMRMIVESFVETLEQGLEKDGQEIAMLPAYVFGWPSGKETGSYLAVDLGGTNLRVCLVELEGDGKFEVTQTKFRLTEEQKQDSGEGLFDFCAECLSKFVTEHYGGDSGNVVLEEPLSLGFTFSYPCFQERIDHGVLTQWTKGFGASGVEGEDAAALFRKSLKKFDVPVELTALINDTTGTLIASAYVNPKTRVGIIYGTGSNGAYMEKAGNIPKLAHLNLPADTDMAINCEWGAFDSDRHENLPRTSYDITIDQTSNKPGKQAYEKMIAGLYLGEIFRLVMTDMIFDGALFLGQDTYKVERPFVFDTAFLSLIESDSTDELLTVTGLFSHFFSLDTTIAERQFFVRLAQLIAERSARLSACGIAAIVTKMGLVDQGCGIATDGSLYNKYPKFPERLTQGLVDIFGEKGRGITTYHAEDGSGVGAAVIAAMTKERKAKGLYPEL